MQEMGEEKEVEHKSQCTHQKKKRKPLHVFVQVDGVQGHREFIFCRGSDCLSSIRTSKAKGLEEAWLTACPSQAGASLECGEGQTPELSLYAASKACVVLSVTFFDMNCMN